mgnify:CR=1 FL=1
MKNRYSIRLLVIVFLSAFAMGICYSCSDDDGEGVKVYEYREQIGKKIKVLTDLQAESQFGLREGMYPETSRAILEDAIAKLKDFLQTIKEAGVAEARIPEETARLLKESDEKIAEFKATVRTEDLLVPAELEVSGKNGGYIDFGAHPEYSTFGEVGKQAFTVEFWVKLKDVEGFFYLISTFTDDDTKDHERKGWAVNSHFGRLRMTYGIGYSDLFEPGFSFSTLNQWVHVAVVTNENGVDGEIRDGIPVMTKIYVNGQLMLSERGRDDRLPYTPNDKEVAMVAFTGLSATANRIGEKSTNGCMRHLHIWKSAKTQAEIQHLMDTPESVTGSESDLVCGWTLNKTVSDNNNIKDLTGKFSARLIGDFQWVENR